MSIVGSPIPDVWGASLPAENAVRSARPRWHDAAVPAPPDPGHPPVARPLGDVATERLRLRRMEPGDVDHLAPVFAKEDVWRFPYGRGLTRAETQAFVDAQVRDWDRSGFACWVASERAGGRVVGFVGLSVPRFLPEILPAVEVGWRLDPDVWGRGYATEGAAAALDEAFTTLGLGEVCSVPQADNPASVRVAERLGMRLARSVTIPPNERRGELTALLFEITAADWHASRPPA
jgi:RimJ/RimL family protein N-acetyltransferase